jgi:inorganic pyrophosphatase
VRRDLRKVATRTELPREQSGLQSFMLSIPHADPDGLPQRHPHSGRLLVLIDTPAGSTVKYKYDDRLGALIVSRVLPDGLMFPYDYGSIPGTRSDDGDALDALVVGLAPSFPGCLIPVRPIGILHAVQTEAGRRIRNDRLIACAEGDQFRARYRTLRQLGQERVRAIELFFETYNRAQKRPFRVTGRGSARDAADAIQKATTRFQNT